MNNQIVSVPGSFFEAPGICENLRSLVLNQNELHELDPKIQNLKKLKVLGIAMTNIQKLPSQITRLKKLQDINVEGTPLKTPKLALAMRGIEAIREFFQQTEEDNDEEDGGDVQAAGGEDNKLGRAKSLKASAVAGQSTAGGGAGDGYSKEEGVPNQL